MRVRSNRFSVFTSALTAGILTLSSVTPALAQPKKPAATAPAKKPLTDKEKVEEAKRLYIAAEAKFEAGDFAGAVPLYTEADALVPGAAPKYKIATALDRQNKAQEAVAAYQAFLDSSPEPEKFKDRITDARTRIDLLKKTPATVMVTTEPATAQNVTLSVDGAAQPGPELKVPPGKRTITASAEGFKPATQEIEVAFGEKKDLALTLEPAPVAAIPPTRPTTPATPPPAAEPASNVPAYVTLGLAGVGAVVGTIFGIQALGAKSDFDASPTTENADRADRNALIADMSYAVALTFGVTGVVLLLSNDSAEDTKKPAGKAEPTRAGRAIVTPYVGPTGGGAAALFTF